ncbi:MAG: NUDIX hydrolase [Deltaproteobacteria bacterium]|nr:NUDIX hydrolase [Deltaproteobacteria bacterium]
MTLPDPRCAGALVLLATFTPADARERDHAEAIAALLQTTPDPFSRAQFIPGHLTASAFVVDPPRSRVLLILHAKLHRWLQPGGHIEPGDADLLAAARREVQEETGLGKLRLLGAPLDVDVHLIPAHKGDPAHRHYDVRFLFEATGRLVRAADDAVQAKWVALDAVGNIGSDESVMRAVRKIRGLWRKA